MREIAEEVLPTTTCNNLPEAGFGAVCSILSVDYDSTMNDACHLRRKGMAPSRASALEQAYDFALAKGTRNGWVRTGEVFVDRQNDRIRAFCVANEEVGRRVNAI